MMSLSSALVLLALALAGALHPARWTATPASALEALSARAPSQQQIERDDALREPAWQHAIRPDVVQPARSSVSQRDGGPERRERSTSPAPAWISLARAAAHESRTAGLDARERASTIGAPGLRAPSSRAPPIA